MSIFLVEWIEDYEIPEIIEELNEEELTSIVGDKRDLQALDNLLVDNLVYSAAEKYRKNNPGLLTDEMIDAERQRVMQELQQKGDTRWAEIRKELFKKVDYILELDINGESFDKKTMNEAIGNRMADPNSVLSKQKLEEEWCDINNLPYDQLKKSPEEIQAEQEAMQAQLQAKQGSPVI